MGTQVLTWARKQVWWLDARDAIITAIVSGIDEGYSADHLDKTVFGLTCHYARLHAERRQQGEHRE
jgi:hypothetical protein